MKNTLHQDTFINSGLPSHDSLPEFLIDHQNFNYPKELNCTWYLLDRWIDEGLGKKIALNAYDSNRKPISLTYQQTFDRVNQLANYLTKDLGLVPGNRVLIFGFNNIDMAVNWLACAKAGLIIVTAMPMLKAIELKKIIDKAEITLALAHHEIAGETLKCLDKNNQDAYAHSLKTVEIYGSNATSALENKITNQSKKFKSVKLFGHDICLIAFTSGTTGVPKGCIHFHRDVLTMSQCVGQYVLETQSGDVFCGTPPLAFTFGLGGLLAFPLYHGAQTVLIEKPSPEVLLKAIQDFKVTTLFTSPTFYKRLAHEVADFDISSLKTAVSAGEKLPLPTHKLWLEKTGVQMIDGIGSTEMIHIFISNTKKNIKMGSIGKPVHGYEAKVFDDNFKELKPYEIGRLAVKGPTGCRYFADARQADYVQRGWNLSGDLVYCDENGYFYYQGRMDDLIVTSGYNVSSVEVEEALAKNPNVEECAVVGVPDEERGSIIKAYIVLRNPNLKTQAMIKEIQDFVKNTIAPYKYPRAIEFTDALPKTNTGKIQRKRLRELN